ncbi:MAG TPA: TMEM175 family protein [Blastococcus sp.]
MTQPVRSGSLGMSVGRMEAFSDGVLAIVITLLILDVKVPVAAVGHLGRELAHQWPQYTAYLLSFLIVGIIWLNHHATVQLLARADHTVQVLNLLLLLSVSILPWPTAVLADYMREGTQSDQRVAVVLYGVASSIMALAFNVLWHYILRHRELQRPDLNRELLAVRNRRYNVGLAAYPLATLLGLLSVTLFVTLMLILAVLYLLPTPDVRSPDAGRVPPEGGDR